MKQTTEPAVEPAPILGKLEQILISYDRNLSYIFETVEQMTKSLDKIENMNLDTIASDQDEALYPNTSAINNLLNTEIHLIKLLNKLVYLNSHLNKII